MKNHFKTILWHPQNNFEHLIHITEALESDTRFNLLNKSHFLVRRYSPLATHSHLCLGLNPYAKLEEGVNN